MRFSNNIDWNVVFDRFEILFTNGTAPNETVAQMDDFRTFLLQSLRF
jgi:hypothetical protein